MQETNGDDLMRQVALIPMKVPATPLTNSINVYVRVKPLNASE